MINIQPGEPIHLRNVVIRVEGPAASLKAFRVPKSDALKTGAVLNHGNYEDAKRLIQNQASRYGFFSGHFTSQRLAIDPRAGLADIELVYDSGPRYSLGKVMFSGNAPFDEDLLKRMVPFKENTPYDSQLIAELTQAMQGSGYFEGVRVDAAPTAADHQVIPVTVQLETRKPRTMGLGRGTQPMSVRVAKPTGPDTGPIHKGTATGSNRKYPRLGRMSACGTTCRSIRR